MGNVDLLRDVRYEWESNSWRGVTDDVYCRCDEGYAFSGEKKIVYDWHEQRWFWHAGDPEAGAASPCSNLADVLPNSIRVFEFEDNGAGIFPRTQSWRSMCSKGYTGTIRWEWETDG